MKYKTRIISILILILLTGPSLADQWVMGASLAVTKHDGDDELLNSQLEGAGLNATADTGNDIRIMWQLYGGYDFAKRWGVELAYLDLGMVNTTFTGTAVDIESFLNSAQEIHPQTAQGWLLSMNHYFHIDNHTRLKVRVGMYDWSADYSLQGGNATKQVSQQGSDLSYGVAMELGMCRATGLRSHIKWDQHTINKKEVSAIAFGVSYCF